jgi:hypothetical protein
MKTARSDPLERIGRQSRPFSAGGIQAIVALLANVPATATIIRLRPDDAAGN